MQLGLGRESKNGNGRRTRRTHFRLLAIRKYDFSEVKKAMITWLYLSILCVLAFPKCVLGEVEEAMLLLDILKTTLRKR